MLSVRAAIGIR